MGIYKDLAKRYKIWYYIAKQKNKRVGGYYFKCDGRRLIKSSGSMK